MKGRRLYLAAAATFATLFGCELFVAMRAAESESAVRKRNGIPEGETWLVTGDFQAPVDARTAYQGPIGTPDLFLQADPELGYRLRANLRALPGKARRAGEPLYDVTYSTGRFGWRVTPQAVGAQTDVLFFGDSYTFGHGLGDADTLPARFSAAMGGRAMVHNFGVPGWGPQQTLRLLEVSGEKAEVGFGRPAKAYYLLIREHLSRLAGEQLESAGSPRYELRDGKPTLAGHFPGPGALAELCSASSLCEWLRGRKRNERALDPATQGKPAELAAVLGRVDEILRERYRARLTVISWNAGDFSQDETEKLLRDRGVDVVQVNKILPDFPARVADYTYPDGHPRANAVEPLAKYLAERLER